MPVLALGLVGAGVGAAIGGTFMGVSAMAIGWTVGTMAGNAYEQSQQRIEGPRIGDLKVQASNYGPMIAVIYGTSRVAGNVIWSTDLREVSKSKRQGKGSGPKVTTYTYNVDMAVLLSAGTMAGIRKIYMNSKLVYDVSVDAAAAAIVASSVNAKGFTFYPGDEAQLPDPTIEAVVGMGSTPAYRGSCYVVFSELDCPNGMIPQLAFELMQTADADTQSMVYADVPQSSVFGSSLTTATVLKGQSYQFGMETGVEVPTYMVGQGYHGKPKLLSLDVSEGVNQAAGVPTQGGPYALKRASGVDYYLPRSVWAFNLAAPSGALALYTYTPQGTFFDNNGFELLPLRAAYDPITERFAVVGSPAAPQYVYAKVVTVMPSGVQTPELDTMATAMAFYDNVIYTCGDRVDGTYLNKYSGDTGELIGSVPLGELVFVGAASLRVHADEGGVYVLEGQVADFEANRKIWKVGATWELLTATAKFNNLDGNATTWYCNDRYAIVGSSGVTGEPGIVRYGLINFSATDPEAPTLRSIITDVCGRAGLAPSQIEFEGVPETVPGYPIARVSPARGSLQPLLRGYAIDAPEVDGKLRFISRAGRTAIADIPYDDLGAGEDGADPFPLSRQQQDELPQRVSVSYIDHASDHEGGTETAARQTVTTLHDTVEELPVCTTPDHAAGVAHMWLHDAWSARNRRTFKLSRKWAWLDAADLVRVEYPRNTHQTMRLTRVSDTGVVLECEAEPADGVLYTEAAAAVGVHRGRAQTVDGLPGPTEVTLLDIPILRDADNDAGLYAAFEGYGNWRGGALFMGLSDAQLDDVGQVTEETPIGYTETALLAWPPNLVDERSIVVRLGDDAELYSITHAQMLEGTGNACAVGVHGRWEVMQFREAEALGAGRWRLTGLRRGLRGTEHNTGLHAANDECVLIDAAAMLRPVQTTGQLNQAMRFKAVSVGLSAADVASIAFTNTGAGLKPLAPVDVRAEIDGNQVELTWGRRTRLQENWLAGMVPLGEVDERYEIEVQPPGQAAAVYQHSGPPPAVIETGTYVPTGLEPTTNLGALNAVVSGGFLYQRSAGDTSQQIVKRNASDLTFVEQVYLGFTWADDLILLGSHLYSRADHHELSVRLRKFDLDLTPVAANTIDMNNVSAMVAMGGYLWLSTVISLELRKIDPATMLLVDTYPVPHNIHRLTTDGTYLYGYNYETDRISKFDSSGVLILSWPCARFMFGLVCSAGLVWGVSIYDHNLTAYDPATGMLVYTLSTDQPEGGDLFGSGQGLLSEAGGYVSVGSRFVQVVDATALKRVGYVNVPPLGLGWAHVSLISPDVLLIENGAYAADRTLDYYTRATFAPGTAIRVYQMSEAVGRGFPASTEV